MNEFFDTVAELGSEDDEDFDEEAAEAAEARKKSNGANGAVDDSSEEEDDDDDEEAARRVRCPSTRMAMPVTHQLMTLRSRSAKASLSMKTRMKTRIRSSAGA
jgi:hypothetical protein